MSDLDDKWIDWHKAHTEPRNDLVFKPDRPKIVPLPLVKRIWKILGWREDPNPRPETPDPPSVA